MDSASMFEIPASTKDAEMLREPLLDSVPSQSQQEGDSWLPEGGNSPGATTGGTTGLATAANKKGHKKKCCKKEKKYKPLARNVRMVYKEFDKKRRWLRFKKIFKNILIAAAVCCTAYYLIIVLIWDIWIRSSKEEKMNFKDH